MKHNYTEIPPTLSLNPMQYTMAQVTSLLYQLYYKSLLCVSLKFCSYVHFRHCSDFLKRIVKLVLVYTA